MFASDPAPQQLTAPCRKYSGRLHHPLEQVVYPVFFSEFLQFAVREGESAYRIRDADYNSGAPGRALLPNHRDDAPSHDSLGVGYQFSSGSN